MRTQHKQMNELMPMSQMEVGCPGARGAGSPPTQTQVGRTPHKPALPATQPQP